MNHLPNSYPARGRKNILNPNFDPLSQTEEVVMDSGEGIRVRTEDGMEYIEAVAGLWCASLGFRNERLARTAYDQLMRLPYYYTSAGKTHVTGVDLAEKLISLSPIRMAKVYFGNSGSDANDSALKMIWYYNNGRGKPEKKKIISRRRGYHGITLATTSLTGLAGFHDSFDAPLPRFHKVDYPDYYHKALPGESEEDYSTRMAADLEAFIQAEGPDTVAAMFMEPIMGGGGVIVPPRTYMEKMQAVLDRHDVLLVADEVICGFGRTGNYWGAQTVGMRPDIITCAKALSAAYLPISATIVNHRVMDVIVNHAHELGAYLGGYTYGAHPAATAVALETLKIYDEMDIVGQVRRMSDPLLGGLRRRLGDHPLVGQVRGAGLMSATELVANKETHESFPAEWKVGYRFAGICQEMGVLLRACPNDAIAVCPPLIVTEAEISDILGVMEKALDRLHGELKRDGKIG